MALLLATGHSLLLTTSPRLCSCLIKSFLCTDPKRCSCSCINKQINKPKCHSDTYIIMLSYCWFSVFLSYFSNPFGCLAEIAATRSFEPVSGQVGQGSF